MLYPLSENLSEMSKTLKKLYGSNLFKKNPLISTSTKSKLLKVSNLVFLSADINQELLSGALGMLQ